MARNVDTLLPHHTDDKLPTLDLNVRDEIHAFLDSLYEDRCVHCGVEVITLSNDYDEVVVDAEEVSPEGRYCPESGAFHEIR